MLRMFWYEIKMDFLRSIRYRFGMISDLLVYFALFTVFMVTDSGNSYAQTYHYGNYKELVLLGYVAWIYAISAISNVAGSLQSELTHGTLYKKVSSKYPLQYLFGGLYVSSVLLETITIVIVVIISKFVWGIEFSFHPAFLVPILLESLGMYGIGLIVAGIAIYFKRTGTIVFLIQTALLFVTDTVPTSDAILKITHYIPLRIFHSLAMSIYSLNLYFPFPCPDTGSIISACNKFDISLDAPELFSSRVSIIALLPNILS